VLVQLGFEPVAFVQISDYAFNTVLLVVVMAWMWTGFAMVILSAALKGINPELLEAARVDGATEVQTFRRITLPLLAPTIAVVTTTMIITALKTFDIVYVMTSGNFDTQVVAFQMIKQLYDFGQPGRASAIAVVLLLAIIPVMAVNIRRFRAQEALR
jgi:alpha-glucoside transport system permease protein